MTDTATLPAEPSTRPAEPLVRVENLRVAFGGVEVVHGVSFEVRRGRCLAIVGESGSGKSVTARSLLGLNGAADVRADVLAFAGEPLLNQTDRQWRAVRGARIGYVLQDALVSLDPLRTVGAEIGEAVGAHGDTGHRRRGERVRQLLDLVGVPDPDARARQRPHELSGGLRQRALIASALAHDPPLVIADEPTTALDATVQARVLEVLAQAVARGSSVILISHDLGVVARLADDVAVMQGGRIVERGPTATVLGEPHHPYTRGLIAAIPSRESRGRRLSPGTTPAAPSARLASAVPGHVPAPDAPPAVRATDLHKAFPGRGTSRTAVAGVSFELHPGRTLGIVGESGSGKSTVARMVLGLTEPDAGSVELHGQAWTALTPARRRGRRHRITLVQQDPLSSFDPRWTVEKILRDSLRYTGRDGRTVDVDSRVDELLDQVGLSATHRTAHPRRLSGGQRQRVAIARALAPEPSIVVCDEPVSALDVSVQARILDLLIDLRARTGIALLFISHDLGVIHHVSDDILVMRHGVVVERGTAAQVFDAPQHAYTRELLAAVPAMPAGVGAPA